MKKNNQHQGFVILFTILIAAIIMVIGLGIYSIASRETVLSGTAREAQYAFYAADAGVECALYGQSLENSGTVVFGTGNPSFDCGVNAVNITSGDGTLSTPYVFNIMVDPIKKTCAQVNVFNYTTLQNEPMRRIVAQGYNICRSDGTPLTTNPILVERDLDTTYVTTGGVAATSSTTTTP